MHKHFFIILFLLFLVNSFAFSQEIEFDLNPQKTKKILLVPFDPHIYFNDATEIIAKKDNETFQEIMTYFRNQLNLQLYNAMMDSCIVINMLIHENAYETQRDMRSLYDVVNYTLATAMQNKPEDTDHIPKKNFWTKHKEKKEAEKKAIELQESKTRIEKGEIVGKRLTTDDKYLHIGFNSIDTLAAIGKRLNVEYFLFINQFEIKGDYGDPYISGNPDATRTLKVHFSLFDTSGELIHGGFGENKIPFHLNNKKEIVNIYFPEVIRQIIRNIDF